MKKLIHGLLVAAMTASSTFAAVSNKTHMTDRGALSNNLAMGSTVRSHEKAHGGFGADVSVLVFTVKHTTRQILQATLVAQLNQAKSLLQLTK